MQFLVSLQSFDYDSFQFDFVVQRLHNDGTRENDGHISISCFVSDDQHEARITDALIKSLINDDDAQCERFYSIVLQDVKQALQQKRFPLFIEVEC